MNLRFAVVAAAFFLASTANGHADDPRDDVLRAVQRCAWLLDTQKRLECYDAAAKRVEDALAAPPPPPPPPPPVAAPPPAAQATAAPSSTTATPAPAQPEAKQEESWFGLPDIFGGNGKGPETTPQQFGSERVPAPPPPPPAPGQPAPPPPPEPLDSITAVVTDVATHLDGRFIVFLDNGQIWQQIPGDTDTAHFLKGQTTKVTISRGILGSYDLHIDGHTGIFKVSRIK